MSNYQRLISYIYTYESGLKGKNVGFAKLETRNSQCRLTVNVKKVVPVGSPLGVYLLSGDGEQRIGTLFSRNGAGEFRALLNADRVEGSGRPLQEFFGLSIHEAENAGHSYTTIWEDAAMNAAEAVEEEEKNADRSQEKLQSRQEEERADQAEESGPESEAEEALEKQEKEAGRPEKEEQKPEEEDSEAEEEEIKPVEEKREAEEEKIAAKEEKTTAEEVQSRAEQEKEEEETKRETEEKNKREKQEEPEEETRRVNVEAAQTAPERAEKTDEAGEQEKNSIRERLFCQNTLPPIRTFSSSVPAGTGAGIETIAEVRTESRTEARTESRTEVKTDRRSTRPRSRRRPDGGMSAREWAENLAAPRGLNRDCKAEAPIKADDRAFIPLHELDDGCSHQRMWARLRRKYPKILAFDYEPGCEILTIKPQDIGLLPREAWIFGNNSFLLHGYYSYRYLILARLENPGGEPRYLLGVPGHYSSNEKYMASMFGFSDFIMSKKQPSGDDCFGYWYTDVRVGN